jgi:hypothetical protein
MPEIAFFGLKPIMKGMLGPIACIFLNTTYYSRNSKCTPQLYKKDGRRIEKPWER